MNDGTEQHELVRLGGLGVYGWVWACISHATNHSLVNTDRTTPGTLRIITTTSFYRHDFTRNNANAHPLIISCPFAVPPHR